LFGTNYSIKSRPALRGCVCVCVCVCVGVGSYCSRPDRSTKGCITTNESRLALHKERLVVDVRSDVLEVARVLRAGHRLACTVKKEPHKREARGLGGAHRSLQPAEHGCVPSLAGLQRHSDTGRLRARGKRVWVEPDKDDREPSCAVAELQLSSAFARVRLALVLRLVHLQGVA